MSSMIFIFSTLPVHIHFMTVPDLTEKFHGCLIESRMQYIRRYLGKGHKDKSPLVQVRVRDDQLIVFNDLPPVEEDIQVYDPRPPRHGPDPPHLLLNGLTPGKEVFGGEPGHDFYDGVEEPVLADIAYRVSAVQRRFFFYGDIRRVVEETYGL